MTRPTDFPPLGKARTPVFLEWGFETLRWQCGITATSQGSHLGFAHLVPGHLRTSAFSSVNMVPLQQAHESLAEVCFLPGQAQGEMRLLAAILDSSGQSVGFPWHGLRPRLPLLPVMYLVRS